jgi:hypothetical protein
VSKRAGGNTPRSLTSQEALGALRLALTVSTVDFSRKHFRERMQERGFDMNDVTHVAKEGTIRRPPEFDIKFRNWKYTVEGRDVEGETLGIVFSVEDGLVTLITGIRP